MQSDKTYVGRGREVGQYGNIAISICLEDCEGYAAESKKNGKHYVNLMVSNRRTADEYGNTKTVYINEYEPKENKIDKATQKEFEQYDKPKKEVEEDSEEIDVKDIPF